MSDWVTTKEAGEILGVSIRTIQRYIERGKLKVKIVGGKNSVKKSAIIKLQPKTEGQTTVTNEPLPSENIIKAPGFEIPEGYLLIDRSTLESLREQIKNLTDSVGEMQLTQKLLIEKGLNLGDSQHSNTLPEPKSIERDSTVSGAVAAQTAPIENVAKAHMDFFGEKEKKGNLNIIWLVASAIAAIVILLLVVNFLANSA